MWNGKTGSRETDFINQHGDGGGGFNFYSLGSTNTSVIFSTPIVTIDSSGNVTASTFNATSDYRIKENVKTLDESFVVDNLNPVTYINTKSGKQDIGLIAHEVQEIYPSLVTGEKDGKETQSVNYIGIIGILINEIKGLKNELCQLKQQLNK